MPMYTFYFCKPDGSSTAFVAFELASDADAPSRAVELLTEHPSCAYVAVWEGDRPVLARHRRAPGREINPRAASM